ncbi:MAG: LysM peptidoglycan-binding domain-containing protein [Gemmatimonadaceae bacterium]
MVDEIVADANDAASRTAQQRLAEPAVAGASLAGRARFTATRFPVTSVLRAAVWALLSAAIVAAIGFVLYAPRDIPRSPRDAALAQLVIELEQGESVEATANVSRRHWWDYFHATPGVLAATERRLIWVGVTPRGLIERDASQPTAFDVEFYPYDSVTAGPGRVFFGTRRGIVVRRGPERDAFIVESNEMSNIRRLTGVMERRLASIRSEAERERRRQEYAAFLARQPVYHDVKAGDALSSIAEQYGLSPDSLKVLNGLTDSRIKAGQRLLVRPGT